MRAVVTDPPKPPFAAAARLVDFGGDRPAATMGDWRWIVGVRSTDEDCTTADDAFADCATVYRVEVLAYRLRAGKVEDAAPLALFRHLLVAGLRASTPHPVVAGGQHDWHDEWWTSGGRSAPDRS